VFLGEGKMKSKSVLIVDDEDEYRAMVSKYLLKIGCACETAPNASNAMDILSRRHFDLVVSDIRMGSGDDGVNLMIKAKERHPPSVPKMLIIRIHRRETSLLPKKGSFPWPEPSK
jgi:DNA-binding NtrC family response regulator